MKDKGLIHFDVVAMIRRLESRHPYYCMRRNSPLLVQPLTSEEAGNLEKNYDRLMQMAAELDRALYTVNLEMQEAYKGFLKVKTDLDMLKFEKSTLIERSRLISRMLSKF